ncbi:MAG: hypothetical protein WC784_01530 [Candidatus Shapirobacteria bacterium]|jgi:hypothetical protein
MSKSNEYLKTIIASLSSTEKAFVKTSLHQIVQPPTEGSLTPNQKFIARVAIQNMESPELKKTFLRQFRKNTINNPQLPDKNNAIQAIIFNDLFPA